MQAICALNPLGWRVDTRVVALHEPLTERAVRPLVTCPLCGQQFLVAAEYKVHLDQSHRLTDDAGTDTELSLLPPAPPHEDPEPEPQPAPRSRWGRGPKPTEAAAAEPEIAADTAPVHGPPAPVPGVAPEPPAPRARTRPARPRVPALPKLPRPTLPRMPALHLPSLPSLRMPGRPGLPSWTRRSAPAPWSTLRLDPTGRVPLVRLPSRAGLRGPGGSPFRLPAIDAGGRYPLALRFGDVALYVPGALLVLSGVAGRGSDAVSLALSVVGAILVMVGMLLPTLHRRVLAAAPGLVRADRTPPRPADAPPHGPRLRPLEEVLLSLPQTPDS